MYGAKGAGKGPPLPGLPNSTICNLPWSGVAVFKDGAQNNVTFCERLSENLAPFQAGGTMFENIDISGVAWNVVEAELFFGILTEKAVPTRRLKAYRCSLDDIAVEMICEWLGTLTPKGLPAEIHLSHNRITDEGFLKLLLSIEAMQSELENHGPPVWLRVEGNLVGANTMNELVAEGRAFFCPKVQDRLQNNTAAIAMPSFQTAGGGELAGAALSQATLPPNYKTSTCKHFAAGFCPRGNSCHFAHGEADLRTPGFQAGPTIVGPHTPPTGAVVLPPARGSVLRPPTGSVVRPPTGSVVRPPTGSVVRPPTGSVVRPPTSSVVRPPAGSVVVPPKGSAKGLAKVVPPLYLQMNGHTDQSNQEDDDDDDDTWGAWGAQNGDDESQKDEGWGEAKTWADNAGSQAWGSSRGGSKDKEKKNRWEKDMNSGNAWGQAYERESSFWEKDTNPQEKEEESWWEKDTSNRRDENQEATAWKENASNSRHAADRSRTPPPRPTKRQAALPYPWEKHESEEYGIPFYWNTETGQSVWEWPPPDLKVSPSDL